MSLSVLFLLVLNLGLIWLLLAAPVGVRTLRVDRLFKVRAGDLWPAVDPRGDKADWHHAILSSRAIGQRRVRQSFSQPDRNGDPIVRTFEVADTSDRSRGRLACRMQVVEDSALDVSFWRHYREERSVQPAGDGALLTVVQTDRYRGLAFLIFRYFSLRRELAALAGWLETGVSRSSGVFEHPATQVALAVASTLLLWPFFGLTADGLMLSSMLTVVIVLHELGHMAAYRTFGHKTVRMIFVPLLGGVAIGGRPYNSLFEVAACALMGAGMSAFLVPAVIAAYEVAALSEAAGPLLIFLLVLGAFNLLNLLPMHRFDGGQVLRQVFSSRGALLAGTFAATLVVLATGWRIGLPPGMLIAGLAVFALLSLIGGTGAKPRRALDPMNGTQRLLAGAGFYGAIGIHAYAVVYACDRLFA